jgi:hypothetical protein
MTLADGSYMVFCSSPVNFTLCSDCDDGWTPYDDPEYADDTDLEPAMGGIRIELGDEAMTDPLIDAVYWWTDLYFTDDWPTSGTKASSVQLDIDDLTSTTDDPADTNDHYTTDPGGAAGNDIWCESTSSTGSEYASGAYGTPGAANHSCP